ncbi:MAG TPA: VWA domain-containing protein [Bryobacteraceae bacterium]|nr:VWA domain-containing protein [Bryobacteraceae bacterium]
MVRWIASAVVASITIPCTAATKIVVTVVEKRSGRPVPELKADDFIVLDDRAPRRVESAEFASGLMDVMLLLDTSLLGGAVQPVAENLVAQLQPKEQMAIVAFHSSADLVQDFTASQELLGRAISSVKYGNTPRLLDAIYAAIDGGFQASTFRRVIVLLTTGVEGPSRVSEREVLRLARRNGVSIYPVYVVGQERSMFENLARQTGGASFNLRDLQRDSKSPPGPRIFEVMRSHYTLTLEGNLSLGDRVEVKVKRPEKLLVSGLPLD